MGRTPGPPLLNLAGSTTEPVIAISSPDLRFKPHLQDSAFVNSVPQCKDWETDSEGMSSVANFCCRAVLFIWKLAQQALTKPIPDYLLKSNKVWELLGHTTDDVKLHISQHRET